MQMGPGFVPTFLYYFVGTTFIVALVVSQQTGIGLETGSPYQVGILFGLVAGLTGAYFHRNVTVSVPFKSKAKFTKTLTAALAELGFQEISQLDEFTVYQRQSLFGLPSAKVFVQIEPNSVTISGRSNMVKALQKRFDG